MGGALELKAALCRGATPPAAFSVADVGRIVTIDADEVPRGQPISCATWTADIMICHVDGRSHVPRGRPIS